MENCVHVLHGLKPVITMVVVQTGFAGVNVFYKLATNDGMSPMIIGAYRFIFASAFLAPLAYITERKIRPKMTWTVLFQAFLCGLFGCSLNQVLYISSLALTSATFTSAMANLIPGVTFILAVSFRMEKLALKTEAGKAKVLGTMIGITGAMCLTFYKGMEVHIFHTNIDLLDHGQHPSNHVESTNIASKKHLLGAFLALASCLSYSTWLVIQAKMSKRYPCQFSSTALMSSMAAIQGVVFALCLERDWSQWKLGWNVRLLTVAYSGIVGSSLLALVTWCVRLRGPLYVSIFTPLMLLLVAIAGALVLNENLYLGSVIGAILIVCGLYIVLWGKGKEMKKTNQLAAVQSVGPPSSLEIVIKSPDDNVEKDERVKDSSRTISTAMEVVIQKKLDEEHGKKEHDLQETEFMYNRG